jgi:hypothetical protein
MSVREIIPPTGVVVNTGVPTVSASPAAGTYSSAQSIKLTSSAPGTIFYTTDGTTPTTSSTSGTSPVTVPVSNTETLKFFAKDTANNVGPISLALFTINPLPTVAAMPPSGTFTGSQSLTLTASTPGTIYYSTDGTTPTISSPSGPTPITGIMIHTNSTITFFAKDSLGNMGPVESSHYTILLPVKIQMNDTTATFGLKTNSSLPVKAEYVSDTSSLVGRLVDTIVVDLKKVGSPTGTVQVGVFNSDQSVKQLFGTIPADDITTTSIQYSFSLPQQQTYQIQSGDRIGIKFSGGDASNYLSIMTDQSNTFDGTNSYLTSYGSGWKIFTGKDIYMILKLHTF